MTPLKCGVIHRIMLSSIHGNREYIAVRIMMNPHMSYILGKRTSYSYHIIQDL